MTVKDVLTQPVVTCQPETNLAAAIALMWQNDCGVLPVLAKTGELVGILTDRDICIALGTRNRSAAELTAREVMGTNPLTCKPADDVRAAMITMRNAKIRRLPVVDEDGGLAGIVSVADIALNAGRRFGNGGTAVSFAEVVNAMQAIFARSVEEADRSVAA
jgi:CBS domain-containing protein